MGHPLFTDKPAYNMTVFPVQAIVADISIVTQESQNNLKTLI